MRSPHRGLLFPTLLVAASILAAHPVRGATPVLDAMKEELQRSVEDALETADAALLSQLRGHWKSEIFGESFVREHHRKLGG